MSDFGRSSEDVTRNVAAILWRHSKSDPLAEWSRCRGGEPGCMRSMDADAFSQHQAQAVVSEVLVPELDSFIHRADLATQVVDRLAGARGTSSKLRWWNSRLVAWLVFGFLVVGFLVTVLKSWSA